MKKIDEFFIKKKIFSQKGVVPCLIIGVIGAALAALGLITAFIVIVIVILATVIPHYGAGSGTLSTFGPSSETGHLGGPTAYTPNLTGEGILDVPLYNQADFGGPCPERIRRVGCGIVSVFMVADYYKVSYNRNEMLQKYGCVQPIKTTALFEHLFNNQITKRYINAASDNFAEIKDQVLNKKNPVIIYTSLSSGTHIVTIVGFQGNNVIINDPNGGRNYSMSLSQFSRKLHYSGRTYKYMYVRK